MTIKIAVEILAPLKVVVEIPALDALVEYLEGKDQQKVDVLTEQVDSLTKRLADSEGGLSRAEK